MPPCFVLFCLPSRPEARRFWEYCSNFTLRGSLMLRPSCKRCVFLDLSRGKFRWCWVWEIGFTRDVPRDLAATLSECVYQQPPRLVSGVLDECAPRTGSSHRTTEASGRVLASCPGRMDKKGVRLANTPTRRSSNTPSSGKKSCEVKERFDGTIASCATVQSGFRSSKCRS